MVKPNNKKLGLCIECDKKITILNSSRCIECNKKQIERSKRMIQKRKQHNQCIYCGNPNENIRPNEPICSDCWFVQIANNATGNGSKTFAKEIKDLFEKQNGLCYYTGKQLIKGKTASLDHIIPKSKGGTHNITNLQWIDRRINRIKNDMPHNEFISFCHNISDKFPKGRIAIASPDGVG